MISNKRKLTILLTLLIAGGIAHNQVQLTDDCGYMEFINNEITIYTNCAIYVDIAEVPSMEIIDETIYLKIPEGIAWQVIPQK